VGARLDVEFKHPHSGQPSRCSGLVRNRVVYLYGLEFVHEQEQETPRRLAPNATVNS
jgi:hypothetical protein